MKQWEFPLRARRIAGVISTDDILPARYKHSSTDPASYAPHVFENILPGYAATLGPRDVLVSDTIFGIGSSREQAVSALLAAGVVAVLAPSFGRIFFRNAWNLGLIALEVSNLTVEEGEVLHISLEQGLITRKESTDQFIPIPPELIEMVAAGGLLSMLRQKRGAYND